MFGWSWKVPPMVAFGASFGYTVMARVSLLIGRLEYLFSDWLGLL